MSKTIFNLNKSRDEIKYIHRDRVSYHVFGVESMVLIIQTAYKCKTKTKQFYIKNTEKKELRMKIMNGIFL